MMPDKSPLIETNNDIIDHGDLELSKIFFSNSMTGYARQVALDFIVWVGKKTYKNWDLPDDIWCGISDGKIVYLSSEQLFELYLKEK